MYVIDLWFLNFFITYYLVYDPYSKKLWSVHLIVLVDCAFLETKEADRIYACTLPLI